MARKPMDGDALAKKILDEVLAVPAWSVKRVEKMQARVHALFFKHRPPHVVTGHANMPDVCSICGPFSRNIAPGTHMKDVHGIDTDGFTMVIA